MDVNLNLLRFRVHVRSRAHCKSAANHKVRCPNHHKRGFLTHERGPNFECVGRSCPYSASDPNDGRVADSQSLLPNTSDHNPGWCSNECLEAYSDIAYRAQFLNPWRQGRTYFPERRIWEFAVIAGGKGLFSSPIGKRYMTDRENRRLSSGSTGKFSNGPESAKWTAGARSWRSF